MADAPPLPTDPVVIRCRGHAAIQASDGRGLELIIGPEWVNRDGAIGYDARFDPAALDRLRGRVRVHLRSGDHIDCFDASISPLFHRGQPLLFRRDSAVKSRSFAFLASKAAADLSRPLIEALRSPAASLEISLTLLSDPVPPGTLYLVAMPIGHQGDLSPRAIDILSSVDLILAEDTRIAHDALAWRGIRTKLQSCFAHNEKSRAALVARRLAQGQRLALVSDAGMPVVSDPGQAIITAALAAGAEIRVIPGPSAVLAALALSGMDAPSFRFAGFPPRQGTPRRTWLQALCRAEETQILFESPHRLTDLLARLADSVPERSLALCRDLTKQSEFVWRGTVAEIAAALAKSAELSGEFTLVLGAVHADIDQQPPPPALLQALLAEGVPASTLAKALRRSGMGRAQAYALAQSLKDGSAAP
jgi:16S rRNA (cytidine1402-2'-O)-methyltransferase